jgi:adenylate kinase
MSTSVSMTKYNTLLLFGAPGAGKGTVGKALGAIPGFVHVACGEVFRNLDLTTTLGKVFVEYSSKGQLVPDEATVELWHASIKAMVDAHRFVPERDLLILDGIPRNLAQAQIMQEHIEVQAIFHLVCTDETMMMERLKRRALRENRFDDANESVIRHRWQVYEEESRPMLGFYPPDTIQQVDALATPPRVLHRILDHLLAKNIIA